MSEKLLKFLLGELKTIRIHCQGAHRNGEKCGAIIEVAMDRLGETFKNCLCPFCYTPFQWRDQAGADHNLFHELAKVVENLRSIENCVQVEFVLPEKG